MTDLQNRTITGILDDLAKKQYSCRELTGAYLKRISSNENLNAFITVEADKALDRADQMDDARKNGTHGPLAGIPIAHKDIFCTQGSRSSAGSKMLDNFVSPYDATVVERLNAAGVVTLGKTNMDEFAMGSSNENSFYGPVKNPWDVGRVPGGSSGGSAAAVAARLCAAATGTDTGGSIRQPAAMCGITGLKPTYGRVSRWGMIAFASSLDQAGPMATNAEDCALLLNSMAGFDPRDSTSINAETPDFTANLHAPLKGLRLGICTSHFGAGLNPAIADAIDAAVGLLTRQGAVVVEIELPNSQHAIPAYYVIAPAEASANLSRYDGVRFGHRANEPRDLQDLYKRSRSEGFGSEVKQRIMTGTFALSAGYYDAYYRKAQQIRRLVTEDYKAAFDNVDLILAPTTPEPAFRLGEKTDDPIAMYLEDVYTITSNLAGLPAASIPVGFTGKLPIGMQIIGNYLDEGRILNLAHQYQQQTDFHCQTPNLGEAP